MTWRPASRDDRTVAVLWATTIVVGVALRPVWLAAAPLLPHCLWHAWTGLPCPGCGTTRAMMHLLRLDPAGALRYNPLAAIGASAFAAAGLAAPLVAGIAGRVPVFHQGPKPLLVALVGVAVAANWIWLICSGV
jgi:hypothetical protein